MDFSQYFCTLKNHTITIRYHSTYTSIMRKSILLVMIISIMQSLSAQEIALKSNIVSDALLNANIGIEMRLAPKWSADLTGDFNFWNLSHDRKWKHWTVMPEARYWLCDALGGHFLGTHLLGGEFNVGNIDLPVNFLGTDFRNLRHNRYQGWMAGIGIAYGYSWMLAKHWNLEAEIGIGYVYSRYDRYECAGCGRKVESDRSHHYVGPTKAAVNLVYVF